MPRKSSILLVLVVYCCLHLLVNGDRHGDRHEDRHEDRHGDRHRDRHDRHANRHANHERETMDLEQGNLERGHGFGAWGLRGSDLGEKN